MPFFSPLLLIYSAPAAPLVVACVLRLRLFGDLVFDFRCSCLVCIVRVFVGEQRRARRELRIQMNDGFWAGGMTPAGERLPRRCVPGT